MKPMVAAGLIGAMIALAAPPLARAEPVAPPSVQTVQYYYHRPFYRHHHHWWHRHHHWWHRHPQFVRPY
jgi:hypothetical protein